ncbi:hypothetical protein L535_2521 [Bordetella bronchiseptica SBL-F6116]|nr:hypothetical protein L489_2714 [Bordetella bronchiseptica 00-P-2730]KDD98356.1 hypothetical protein L535_2521 [Bordetella bronchiseptica SBL-F6116]
MDERAQPEGRACHESGDGRADCKAGMPGAARLGCAGQGLTRQRVRPLQPY